MSKLQIRKVISRASCNKYSCPWMASSFQHDNIPGEILLDPVVQKVDSAIHWINQYPVDNAISFRNTYPMDSNLSGG